MEEAFKIWPMLEIITMPVTSQQNMTKLIEANYDSLCHGGVAGGTAFRLRTQLDSAISFITNEPLV